MKLDHVVIMKITRTSSTLVTDGEGQGHSATFNVVTLEWSYELLQMF